MIEGESAQIVLDEEDSHLVTETETTLMRLLIGGGDVTTAGLNDAIATLENALALKQDSSTAATDAELASAVSELNTVDSAIQVTLGVNPQGSYTTVADRLDGLDEGESIFVQGLTIGGGGAAGNTTKIQTAIDEAAALGRGSTVRLPPGQIDVNDTLTIPVRQVNIEGVGADATELYWASDLGSGHFAIDFQITSGDPTSETELRRKRKISNLKLKGPGAGTGVMWGLKWSTNLIADNVEITGFKAGLYQFGNHQTAIHCYVYANYYGFIVPAASPTLEDQAFYSTLLVSNTRASVYVEQNVVLTASFFDTHFGFCPFAFEAAAGGSQLTAMGDCIFDQCYAESVIALVKTNNRWIYRTRFNDIHTRHDSSFAGGQSAAGLIDCGTGSMQKCSMDHPSHDFASGSTFPAGYISANGILDCNFDNMQAVMDTVEANNWPFVTNPTVDGSVANNNRVTWGNKTGIIVRAVGVTADPLQYDAISLHGFADPTNDLIRQGEQAVAGQIPLGVGVHAQVSGKQLLVAERGTFVMKVTGSGVEGDRLVASATAGSLRKADGLADLSIFGICGPISGGHSPVKVAVVILPKDLIRTNDSRLSDARAPSGAAGGVLGGSFPNPDFAVDMATQAEFDAADSAIWTTLGVNPQGSAADVATRLAYLDDALGTGIADAMLGSDGAPSLNNPYTTLTDPRFRGSNDGEN